MGVDEATNGSPWWARTSQRLILNVGPLVVISFVLLGVNLYMGRFILTNNPTADAHAHDTKTQAAIKDATDNLRAEILANRDREVEGDKRICKLLAIIAKQNQNFCDF